MRDFARRFALTRLTAAAAAAALATLVAAAAVGAPSALAAGSVSIKTSFENNTVSLNTSDAIGFAITNTTGVAQNVTFTDTLPAGVTLDSPIGLTNTPATGLSSSVCSSLSTTNPSSGQPSAPGDGAVTITVSVQPQTSGTVCTISLATVPGVPSINDAALKDSYSSATYTPTAGGSATAATTTPGSVIVLSNPTISFTAPKNGQTFALGQIFDANFSCAATDPLDSISSSFGTDDEGNQIENGGPVDTVDAGARSFEVDCYSVYGAQIVQTIAYRVSSYTLVALRSSRADVVSFRTRIPAGKLLAKVVYGKRKTVIGTATVNAASGRTASVRIIPTASGRKLLAALPEGSVRATLKVSFTPRPIGSGDQQISPSAADAVSRTVALPLAHASTKRG